MAAMLKEAKRLVAQAHSGRAKRILKALPKAVKEAAKDGSADAIVMDLNLEDYDQRGFLFWEKFVLKGAAKEVFDTCQNEGLNPVIFYSAHSDHPGSIRIKLG